MYYLTVIFCIAGWAWLAIVASFVIGYLCSERAQKRIAAEKAREEASRSTPPTARQ